MITEYSTVERQSYDWWLSFWQKWDSSIEPINRELLFKYWFNLQLVPMPNVQDCYQLIAWSPSNADEVLMTHIDAPADHIEACTALNALREYLK